MGYITFSPSRFKAFWVWTTPRPQDAAKACGCSTWRFCRSQLWDLRVSWQNCGSAFHGGFRVDMAWRMTSGTARTWIERTLQQFERNLGDEGMDAWTDYDIPPKKTQLVTELQLFSLWIAFPKKRAHPLQGENADSLLCFFWVSGSIWVVWGSLDEMHLVG